MKFVTLAKKILNLKIKSREVLRIGGFFFAGKIFMAAKNFSDFKKEGD